MVIYCEPVSVTGSIKLTKSITVNVPPCKAWPNLLLENVMVPPTAKPVSPFANSILTLLSALELVEDITNWWSSNLPMLWSLL